MKAVVCGGSAGSHQALSMLLKALPATCKVPWIVVLHVGESKDDYRLVSLQKVTKLCVKEVEDKQSIEPNCLYLAPHSYHLLVEPDFTLSFSLDEKVCYSRPSIDILFESAAWSYKDQLVGILLSGANNDGAHGLAEIKRHGGTTFVQEPASAQFDFMPKAAIAKTQVDYILAPDKIAQKLQLLYNA